MKVLSSEQIRRADAYTIENEPIRSIDLMERASKAFIRELFGVSAEEQHYVVFAGPGNNGGDGLAVARLLQQAGKTVFVIYVHFTDIVSQDFITNRDRLTNTGVSFFEVSSLQEIPQLPLKFTVIDAIFGSGLSRTIKGFPAEIVRYINALEQYVVSIDIPSGLFDGSNSDNSLDVAIQADLTISFQVPKLCFLLPETARFVGDWIVTDIGLDEGFLQQQKSSFFTVDKENVSVSPRDPFAHKGNFGHALLCAGSLGKMGAAVLSSRSCLRSGVGLLSVVIPECGYTIIQESVPEAMAIPTTTHDMLGGDVPDLNKFNVVGVGPGIGTEDITASFLKDLFAKSEVPFVIDADALNLISKDTSILNLVNNRAVLTPHPKEFDRIAGPSNNTYERVLKQIELSKKYQLVIVLKGHHTSISVPNGTVYFNTTGNPGMSTAGSGDVLTGIILAFLAMGYSPTDASIKGVYLHGLAGDLASTEISEESMIASDIISYLPAAFKELKS